MKIKTSKGYRVFTAFNTLLMVLLLIITAYPIYYCVVASFSDPTMLEKAAGKILLLPFRPLTVGAYGKVLSHRLFLTGCRNTLFILVVGTTLNMVLTIMAGYGLSRKGLMLNPVFTFLIVFTMYFSGGLVPGYLNIRDLGLLDTIWAIILPMTVAPFYIFLLRQYMVGLPGDMIEAAQIDGAGTLRCFIHVVLPVCQPILGAAVALSFADCWNLVEQPLTYLTTHTELYPLSVVFNQLTQQSTGVEFAGAALYTLPALLIYLYFQNDILEGVQLTELK